MWATGEPPAPPVLTPEEVADELRVDREWVYRKARAGDIPAMKLGRVIYERGDNSWGRAPQTCPGSPS